MSHAVLTSAYSVPATTATDDRFVCVVRNVANMADNLQSWAAQNYFDITADGNGIHRGLKQKMKELRNNFIKSKVWNLCQCHTLRISASCVHIHSLCTCM